MSRDCPNDRAPALVPLTLFEAIQSLDAPEEEGPEVLTEMAARRLGRSPTVALQIKRYRKLLRGGKGVDHCEVEAVLRLVGRRSDAALVFAEAGRRAGSYLARSGRMPGMIFRRLMPLAGVRESLGWKFACRAAAAALGAELVREAGTIVARVQHSLAVRATPDGSACGFYGSALAELLRNLISFEGALFHERCKARGDPVCRWRSVAQFGV